MMVPGVQRNPRHANRHSMELSARWLANERNLAPLLEEKRRNHRQYGFPMEELGRPLTYGEALAVIRRRERTPSFDLNPLSALNIPASSFRPGSLVASTEKGKVVVHIGPVPMYKKALYAVAGLVTNTTHLYK